MKSPTRPCLTKAGVFTFQGIPCLTSSSSSALSSVVGTSVQSRSARPAFSGCLRRARRRLLVVVDGRGRGAHAVDSLPTSISTGWLTGRNFFAGRQLIRDANRVLAGRQRKAIRFAGGSLGVLICQSLSAATVGQSVVFSTRSSRSVARNCLVSRSPSLASAYQAPSISISSSVLNFSASPGFFPAIAQVEDERRRLAVFQTAEYGAGPGRRRRRCPRRIPCPPRISIGPAHRPSLAVERVGDANRVLAGGQREAFRFAAPPGALSCPILVGGHRHPVVAYPCRFRVSCQDTP